MKVWNKHIASCEDWYNSCSEGSDGQWRITVQYVAVLLTAIAISNAVDPVDAPGYDKIVKLPMDFGTVKLKLEVIIMIKDDYYILVLFVHSWDLNFSCPLKMVQQWKLMVLSFFGGHSVENTQTTVTSMQTWSLSSRTVTSTTLLVTTLDR